MSLVFEFGKLGVIYVKANSWEQYGISGLFNQFLLANMQIVPRLLSENSNTVLSTTCAPCDQCDPTYLHIEKDAEVWISNRSSRVEKKTKKDAEGHIGHIGHKTAFYLVETGWPIDAGF